MFGFFHTCVGKATDMLISPWAIGGQFPQLIHQVAPAIIEFASSIVSKSQRPTIQQH